MATTMLASPPPQLVQKSFHHLSPASSRRLPLRRSGTRRRRPLHSSAPPPADLDWPFEQRIRESLVILDLMDAQSIAPDPELFAAMVKSCTEARSLRFGRVVHDKAVRTGLHTHPLVTNSLILLYGQCGHLITARRLFDEMPDPNVVSWTTIISLYHHAGFPHDALDLFRSMTALGGGVRPNLFTYTIALNCCASVKDLELGFWIHEEVVKDECEGDDFIVVALIDMYGKCGRVDDARVVFDQMTSPTIEACTAMIEGYNRNNEAKEAIDIMRRVFQRGVNGQAADKLGYASIIESLNMEKALRQGQEIHAHIIKLGHQPGLKALALLVELYAECGKMMDAKHMFDDLVVKDYSLCAKMIEGLVRQEMYVEAFKLFAEMTSLDLKLNHMLVSLAIKACMGMLGVEEGKQIHGRLFKFGEFLDEPAISDLLELYHSCQQNEEADKLMKQK